MAVGVDKSICKKVECKHYIESFIPGTIAIRCAVSKWSMDQELKNYFMWCGIPIPDKCEYKAVQILNSEKIAPV